MKIDTKFNLGQKVWVMVPDIIRSTKLVKCSACEGKGKVILKDERSYICPNCQGSGKIAVQEYKHSYSQRFIMGISIYKQEVNCVGAMEVKPMVIVGYELNPKRGQYRREITREDQIFETKTEVLAEIKRLDGMKED